MAAMIASNSKRITTKDFATVIALLILIPAPSSAEGSSFWGRMKGIIAQSMFPNVQVTLYNESEDNVLFMCSFGRPESNSLRVLKPGKQNTWDFTQFAFPLHWCYVYMDDNRHGFFWAYGVRSRCMKCFWKVGKFPYLYRSDRNRWERQQLFPPPNVRFNLTLPIDM